MKLVRFGQAGHEKPGVLVDGVRRDCSAFVSDYDRAFFQGGGVDKLAAALGDRAAELLRFEGAMQDA